jgi:hypothetical protein
MRLALEPAAVVDREQQEETREAKRGASRPPHIRSPHLRPNPLLRRFPALAAARREGRQKDNSWTVLSSRISLRSFAPLETSRLPNSKITRNRICCPLEIRVWQLFCKGSPPADSIPTLCAIANQCLTY